MLIARVRREPDFARACFERVGPEHRDRFLAWFGYREGELHEP